MRRLLMILFLGGIAGAFFTWQTGIHSLVGPLLLAALVAGCLLLHMRQTLRGLTFSAWIVATATAALFYPELFLTWGEFDLKRLIVPAIQIVMFGMGISVSPTDFVRALQMPKAVFIGIFLQYGVMPLSGAGIAWLFGFAPDVAAGVVLIGSCSGGVASNVMAFLAKGNVALSVTMTACSTMLAPLATPALMNLLAGRLVPVPFWEMMWSIVNMIILPVAAGIIVSRLLEARRELIARVLPVVAMVTICGAVVIITANSRDKLLAIGFALILASILHNTVGYMLGYGGARLVGLNQADCRTVAFEVGMQNGGMATGLAIDVLRSSNAALAPAIFGTWMNVSGAALASWWRNREPAIVPGEQRVKAGEVTGAPATPSEAQFDEV